MRTIASSAPVALFCACVLVATLTPCCRGTAWVPADASGEGADVQQDGTLDNRTRDERILDSWAKFEVNLQGIVDKAIRKMLPTVIRRSSDVDVSPECRDALLKVVFGLRQLKRWAFQCEY
ncbi:unnamed protein product [Ixodes hexagonus]